MFGPVPFPYTTHTSRALCPVFQRALGSLEAGVGGRDGAQEGGKEGYVPTLALEAQRGEEA